MAENDHQQGPSESGLGLRPKRKVSKWTENNQTASCAEGGMRRSKRICQNNANESRVPKTLDEICTGTFILENVMGFLDTRTLKICRTVSKNWEETARKVLMKRSFLNITRWTGSVKSRMQQYSSWIVDYEIAEKTFGVSDHLRKWGESVKSLYIKGLTDDLRWSLWIRNVLTSWCPNVVAIRLEFALTQRKPSAAMINEWNAFRQSLESTESREEFRLMLQTKRTRRSYTFQYFQTIPNLPKIQSIRLQRCDGMACQFAFNLIQSCGNLKFLFINLEILDSKILDGSEFEILKYLAVRPDITKKLDAFEWTYGYGFERNLYQESQRQLVSLITANPDIPPMEFGSRLKSLHWDVLHVDRNGGQLLPGILEKVAGNLRKLGSRTAVLDARDVFEIMPICRFGRARDDDPPRILSVQFPMMPKLSVIEIGQKTCFTISLSELVDAAPNLRRLEITDGWPNVLQTNCDIWTGSGSALTKTHPNLKYLKAGESMKNADVLRKTVGKFPNLVQVEMAGGFHIVQLENLVDILGELKSLKRLYRSCDGAFGLARLIDHIAEVPRKLASLETYGIRFVHRGDIGRAEYFQKKSQLHKKIRANNNVESRCHVIVTWLESSIPIMGLVRRIGPPASSPVPDTIMEFLKFIKIHNIPIQFKYFKIPVYHFSSN
jgi:hypothetical protein